MKLLRSRTNMVLAGMLALGMLATSPLSANTNVFDLHGANIIFDAGLDMPELRPPDLDRGLPFLVDLQFDTGMHKALHRPHLRNQGNELFSNGADLLATHAPWEVGAHSGFIEPG